VDAAEVFASRPRHLKEQSNFFQNLPTDTVLSIGASALDFVTTLLSNHNFKVYTKWERVPESERYYGFITVEMEQGEHFDLGEVLVSKGYASPMGRQISGLPAPLLKSEKYVNQLGKAMAQAKAGHVGAWAKAE
jgi:endonuclease YncB( thermonuclease family)